MPADCRFLRQLQVASRCFQSFFFVLIFSVAFAVPESRASDPEDEDTAAQPYNAQTYGSYSYGQQSGDAYSTDDPYDFELRSADQPNIEKPGYDPHGQYRQPVSIAVLNEKQTLISTKKSGEIYCLHTPSMHVEVIQHAVEASWGKLIRLTESVFAAVESSSQEIVIMRLGSPRAIILGRLTAPGAPNDLVWDENRRELLATGIWSQRLYRWKLAADDSTFTRWSSREQADLPMCGGCILVLPQHQCTMVVDAFGRHYAIVGNSEFRVQHQAQLYGHNVTGLAATEDESMVYFPHQLLNEYARAVRTDITWGGMMSNNLRWLQTERLLSQHGEQVFKKSKFYPLGSPGNGAGDPSSMAVSSAGRIAVTLGGTNRVAIGNEGDYYFRQVNVGYRPVDCAYSQDESLLYVVNQFSDSLSVVDLKTMVVQQVQLGPLREPNEEEYGEQLFYNARISHDGWMSCHSCHSEGHTNGQLNDNFSDGSYGTPKRVLSLLGQAETMPYAWSGKVDSLETQVGHSIRSTMAGDREPSPTMIRAMAAFVAALPSPPSLEQARKEHEPTAEEHWVRGRQLYSDLGCADCHAGEHLTSSEAYDVGMIDENGMRWFNPPSLVSVSQRQTALLHDARATSLRDVLVSEQHQLSEPLSERDVDDLIRYLKSL